MSESEAAGESPGWPGVVFEDTEYRLAVVDLLGAIAYGELSAFERLVDDAKLAPTVRDKVEMGAMATLEFGHVARLHDRIRELGSDPFEAMAPFEAALDLFHAHTAPADWYEGLVKAYVGDGLAADFYREIAAFLPEPDRTLVEEVLADTGHADFAVREVRAAIAADGKVAGRLALWARRLVGEAISQTQHVLADRDALMMLMIEGTGGLAGVGELINRVTSRHEERMKALGLDS